MRERTVGLVVWILLSAAWAAAADSTKGLEFQVEIRARGDGLETREQSTMTWWDGRWAESSPDGSLVIDLTNDRFLLVDHVHKLWTGGPIETFLGEMEREIGDLAGKVKGTYGLNPQGLPAGVKPPEVRVESSGIESKAGRKCLHYKLFAGNELKEELWLDPAQRPGDYLPIERLMPVLNRFSANTAIFSREFHDRADFESERALQAELARLFPLGLEVFSLEYSQGKVAFEKKITDVREWAGDPARFQYPADYQKVSYREYLDASLPEVKQPFGSENEKE
jgi:hypothetical protein